MENYCFCFDIDGTLICNGKEMSSSTLTTLHMLQEKGHKIVLATGRNYGSVKRSGIMDAIKWDGYVFNNGQCVLDADLNTIYLAKMSQQNVEKIIQVTEEEGLVCLLERVYDWFIVQKASEYTKITHQFFHDEIPQQKKYDPSMEIIMAIVYAPKGYDYQPYKQLKGIRVDEGLSCYADIVCEGFHKYKGIEKILTYFQMDKSVCFGDGKNDVDMIKEATIGVAMGQGAIEAKEASDFVTLSCEDDGITYACKYLGFLNE
ncbi:MAG: Cof-type HAD-IIB family hydrolase [Traorella sp.]